MSQFISTKEKATQLGASEWTVCEYAKAGRFPGAFLLGRRWRFPADAVPLAPEAVAAAQRGKQMAQASAGFFADFEARLSARR